MHIVAFFSLLVVVDVLHETEAPQEWLSVNVYISSSIDLRRFIQATLVCNLYEYFMDLAWSTHDQALSCSLGPNFNQILSHQSHLLRGITGTARVPRQHQNKFHRCI
jgi:hypothetical protein